MRQRRAAVTVLTVVLMSLLMAGPASAGGPTSVLLVEPATGTTSALYYSDPDYETLATLIGANSGTPVSGTEDRSSATHETGSAISLTWLLHDITVWRVDRIYFAAEGGPWIASQFSVDGSQSIWDSPVVWHRVPNGKVLAALLQRAGFEPGAAGTENDAVAEAVDNAPVQPVTPAPSQLTNQPASSRPIWGGWAWGLAGLALGVALAAAAMHVVPRVRRAAASHTATDPAEPELTAHTTPPDVDDELAWTPADELSWSGSPRG